jgi:hypothetical protein
MARRKKGRRGRGKKSVAIVPYLGMAAGALGAYGTIKPFIGTPDMGDVVVESLTGYSIKSGEWHSTHMKPTYLPIIGATAASIVGKKLRLNKYIKLPKGFRMF